MLGVFGGLSVTLGHGLLCTIVVNSPCTGCPSETAPTDTQVVPLATEVIIPTFMFITTPQPSLISITRFPQVVTLGLRPQFPPGTHEGYARLAQSCWDGVPSQRPSFYEVVVTLNAILNSI